MANGEYAPTKYHLAASRAINETSTNPSPQSVFLATTAAKNGYREGLLTAQAMLTMISMHYEEVSQVVLDFFNEEIERELSLNG